MRALLTRLLHLARRRRYLAIWSAGLAVIALVIAAAYSPFSPLDRLNHLVFDTYQKLKAQLDELEKTRPTGGNRVFYLSTPPAEYPTIVQMLGKAGLINQDGGAPFTRVIIEKPFGRDLESARRLLVDGLAVMRELETKYWVAHFLTCLGHVALPPPA